MNDRAISPYLASTTATGGGGNNFETKVQAYFILQLIDGLPTAKRGYLTRIQLQARCLGINTDDIVRTYTRGTAVERIFTECKTGVSAVVSNKAFKDAITGAWFDYSASLNNADTLFNRSKDKLALIYEQESSNKNMTTYRRLLDCALTSVSAEDFARKGHTQKDLDILNAIAQIVGLGDTTNPANVLWPFLQVLQCTSLQFRSDSLEDHDRAIEIIMRHVKDPDVARIVWRGLVQQTTELNANGATIDDSNLHFVIARELLQKLRQDGPQLPIRIAIPSFPWGAQLWAVHELRLQRSLGTPIVTASALSLLRQLRAIRIAMRLAPDQVDISFSKLAWAITSEFDALLGNFDDRAALALFISLNLMSEPVQCTFAKWAERQAAGRREPHLREVEFTLSSIYAHYHEATTRFAEPGIPRDKTDDYGQRRKNYPSLHHVKSSRFLTYWMERTAREIFSTEPEVLWLDTDRFDEIRSAIGDNYPSYRHPAHDTAAWPGNEGVATFEALMRAVRSGGVAQALSDYWLCTSEATFERLLNVEAELQAHIMRGIQCISKNDVYILAELNHLIENAIASASQTYVYGKLLVLPVQPTFPLRNNEIINLPFVNHSLAPTFEEKAREDHESVYDEDAQASHEEGPLLWAWRTIFADVMLAMTLKAKMFANSVNEANVANMHGIGVSKLRLTPRFFDD